ncbi:MAG: polysaccharide deacetylase family protein [Prevotellaceae bacterium]|nr:polysaccharide deacetylase family protein [Prevotellaceae bacterium]
MNRKRTSSLLLAVQQLAFFLFPVLAVCSAVCHLYILFCMAATVTAVLVWGIFDIRLSLFVPVINRLKTEEKRVVLTFDDGPSDNTGAILSTLERENVRAVFFFTGRNVTEHAAIVRKAVQSGHSTGIHTQNHLLRFPFSGMKRVKKELTDNIAVLEQITGQKTCLFRPPFGVMNPIIAKSVRDFELVTVGWTVRSLDTTVKDSKRILKKISRRLSPGAIILLHDIPVTAGILPELIAEIRKKGYEFEKI